MFAGRSNMPAGKPKDKNMIKARLVVLAQMFYTKTDEQHTMTGLEILDYLENQNPSGHILLALSMATSDYYSLPLRFAQTMFTAEQAMNRPGIHKCEDYAFAYIRDQIASVLTISGLRHPALSVLEEYDRENHTSLRETLTVFLQNHCSILETANNMYVHRNTVKYRIARIQEITGLSFDDAEDLKYLCVSDWVL